MEKAKKVINYYVLCNRLKDTIRTGWEDWNVKRERIESVAEHVYSTQMLAIAMKSEYQYDIDIEKVLFMLAIHELGETIIGDLTRFQVSKEEKEKKEHEAVHNVLKTLIDGETIEELFLEFDERITPEARFAYQCDKLECDLQSKLYDQEHCVDLSHQENNNTVDDESIKQLLSAGCSFSTMWLKFWQKKASYDEHFMEVSNYAMTHELDEPYTK